KEKTLTVKLGELPSEVTGESAIGAKEGVLSGLTVAALNEVSREKYELPNHLKSGVVVTEVEGNSSAARAGFRPGDVIMELNRRPIDSVDDFTSAYKRAKGRLLL